MRVNDRGPFLDNRLIDLSYTAAHRLGVLGGGSALVEVETIIPDGTGRVACALRQRAASRGREPPAAPQSPCRPSADPIAAAIARGERDLDDRAQPRATRRRRIVAAGSAAAARRDVSARRSGGVYLQLGAFGSRENAESYLARAKVQVEWLAERLQVRGARGLYPRARGPVREPGEARQAADRIALALGVKPVVITR